MFPHFLIAQWRYDWRISNHIDSLELGKAAVDSWDIFQVDSLSLFVFVLGMILRKTKAANDFQKVKWILIIFSLRMIWSYMIEVKKN